MIRLILVLLTISSVCFAQSTVSNTSTSSMGNNFWSRLKEQSKINYFAEMAGSKLSKWDDNQYDKEGNKLKTPANMWHMFNLQTVIYKNTSFFMSPRFWTQFGDRNELKETDDQNVVVIDDWQFGVAQLYTKTDKFQWDGRLTHRQPFSKESKELNIDSQIEYQNNLMWKPTSSIMVLNFYTLRYYQYSPESKDERYRLNSLTMINYFINDKFRMQLFNEWDMQHRNPKDPKNQNHRDWNYFKQYKDTVALGVGYSPSSHWTFMPFIKMLNDRDWSSDTAQMGLWVLGKIL